MKSADVLPVLLQQRHQEVDGKVDVADKLISGHVNMTDGHPKNKSLVNERGKVEGLEDGSQAG